MTLSINKNVIRRPMSKVHVAIAWITEIAIRIGLGVGIIISNNTDILAPFVRYKSGKPLEFLKRRIILNIQSRHGMTVTSLIRKRERFRIWLWLRVPLVFRLLLSALSQSFHRRVHQVWSQATEK